MATAGPSSSSSNPTGWRLDHSYAALPALFFSEVAPTPVRAPRLVILNHSLATQLGLDPQALGTDDAAALFAGNRLPPGAKPIAQAYAGHQYGHFTALGDGRAILLGEQLTPTGGRFDIQLKGPGPTPYSRRGDGRAALGPMLREYLVSEAMDALGIPTTRSLAVAATGESVFRETELPGAVLTRVASSHIRVGTFQWAAGRGEPADVRALVDYTLRRHYPAQLLADNPAQALLDTVIERQARLLAQWMLVGFVHGVMNTDNMAVSGETIDYGPCAFMDAYDPATVFSSIDRHGRYAYGSQPVIAQWNLTRFAETLLPLLDAGEEKAIAAATESLQRFPELFGEHWLVGMRGKLGLFNAEAEDAALFKLLLEGMHAAKADYTNTFAGLCRPEGPASDAPGLTREFIERYAARLKRQSQPLDESLALSRASCPAFIPRNHLVEAALAAASQGDLAPLQKLLEILGHPYDHDRVAPEFQQPAPEATAAGYQTYCGT
ncbi:MAG TPA: YdiU family protein [Lacunisphaera sp.]|nr:YdiU family protein [Lacunisphaera sp.]